MSKNSASGKTIVTREVPNKVNFSDQIHPVLARVYAARGLTDEQELDYSLSRLLPYQSLKNIDAAVALLMAALGSGKKILIVADFDADGAASCALAIRCLSALGASVQYLVPNRFEYGYGLTPEIVDIASEFEPDLIITVDNGISSLAGVAHARALGIDVLVTDHHLPGAQLPGANVIVNPNQPGDDYASKHLAGVGVIFNIMIALRASLRAEGWFQQQAIEEFNLANLLDLVALGTVADVVPLDQNNRIMVSQGLARIRAGQCCVGISELLQVAGRNPRTIVSADLGFAVGPRLNAAGRLTDMSIGIECLLTDDVKQARELAQQLHDLNLERRSIQQDMEHTAFSSLDAKIDFEKGEIPAGICLFDEDWHQGVVGVLASRVKEKLHRPVIVFAPDQADLIKGSARSISGVHIRDVLESIATQQPGLIEKFGGHAMAAGLTIRRQNLSRLREMFTASILQQVDKQQLNGMLLTDGKLTSEQLQLELAAAIRNGGPWGQAFPEPLFIGDFIVSDWRIVGEKHVKLRLSPSDSDSQIEAIAFNQANDWDELNKEIRATYRLDINEFAGRTSLQLVIENLGPIPSGPAGSGA